MVRRLVPHVLGLSSGEYVVEPHALRVTLVVARAEARGRGDGLPTALRDAVGVTSPAGACQGHVLEATATEEDGLLVRLAYGCPEGARPTRAVVELGRPLGPAHQHVARVRASEGGAGRDLVVAGRVELELPAPASAAPAAPQAEVATDGAASLVPTGAGHVLGGWDHLAFLLGLALPAVRARALALTVTAFTVGHTLSLAAAAFGVLVPAPRLVEPLVAASVAWVGVEVLRGRRPGAAVALPFGLVHGLAFAEALEALAPGPGDARLVGRVLAFNLGVELGQLVALVPLVGLSLGLVRLGPRGEVARRVLAVVLVLVGAVTALVRATGG